jgi:hypothetical protein
VVSVILACAEVPRNLSSLTDLRSSVVTGSLRVVDDVQSLLAVHLYASMKTVNLQGLKQ